MASTHPRVTCRLCSVSESLAVGLTPQLSRNLLGKTSIEVPKLCDFVWFATSQVWSASVDASLGPWRDQIFKLETLCEFAAEKGETALKGAGIIRSRERGRMLCASEELDRSKTVLIETPLLCVRHVECTCGHEDLLRPEHIHAAVALEQRCVCDDDWVVETVLSQLSCGFIDAKDDEGESKPRVAIVQKDGCWSFLQATTLCVAAALASHCLYSTAADKGLGRQRMEVLFSILARLPNNAHSISTVQEVVGDIFTKVREVEQKRVGLALFSSASACNHDCRPNAAVRWKLAEAYDILAHPVTLEIVTARNIKGGEELCISYGPVAGKLSRDKRQAVLSQSYCFRCKCKDCRGSSAEHQEHTPGTDVDPEVAVEEALRLCNAIESMQACAARVNSAATELLMKGDVGVATHFTKQSILPLIEQARQILAESFSNPPNPNQVDYELYLNVHAVRQALCDLAAQVYAQGGAYARSASLLAEAIEAMTVTVPPTDPAVARDRIKLAQLYFNAGDSRGAYEPLMQGMTDLEPFVDVGKDVDYIEAHAIRQFLQRKTTIPSTSV